MNNALICMGELYLDMRTIRKSGRFIHADGTDQHNNRTHYIMDKLCLPNLMADTYGYAHVLFVVIKNKVEKWNKYCSLG